MSDYVDTLDKNLAHIKESNKTVYVGMSGGVDSSVTAHILTTMGIKVAGVYLDCWEHTNIGCVADDDRTDALKVATQLGIKLITLNYIKEYKEKVLDQFISYYKRGMTPNPDIWCNTYIKFGVFADYVTSIDKDAYIATGHYSKILEKDARLFLARANDDKKDQSYFLYDIRPELLGKIIFPVGGWDKTRVREYATGNNIRVYSKRDSQGVCFTGGVNVSEYLANHIKDNPGLMCDTSGNKVGKHRGLHLYTIGQAVKTSGIFGKKVFVIEKKVDDNILIVGEKESVGTRVFSVYLSDNFDISYISNLNNLFVQIRNTGSLIPCSISHSGGRIVNVSMEASDAVAEGQSAVFYNIIENQSIVVGGGLITK